MKKLLQFGALMGGIMQQAFIVPDIKAGIDHFTKHLKIGPFFVVEHFPLTNYQYRGRPGNLDVTIALAFSGDMCFELIQQNDGNRSVYTETYEKRGWGFHHWAVATDQFDDDVKFYQDQGAPLALYGVAAVGARAAYMDTTATLPGMVELIEITPQTEQFFATIRETSIDWDGRDPIRHFA